MMNATYINSKNAIYYLPMVPEELIYEANILIGVQDDYGTACGVLAASEQLFGEKNDIFINLLYIYVHPNYRNNGAGTKMLSLLTEYAKNRQIAGIQTQYPAESEKMTLWTFLENKGFESLMDEADEIEYRFPICKMKERLVSQNIKVTEKLVFLEDLEKAQWERLNQYVDEMQKKGRCITLLSRNAYSQNYSCAAFYKEEVTGCAMVTLCGNGDIELKNLIGENAKLLLWMLSEIVKRISSDLGDDAMIRVITSSVSNKMSAILNSEDISKTELVYQFIAF